ncbi:MAG: PD-(D/E)XK nuclease family protein, partial [Thermoanaerobaculia bacterium]
DLDLAAAEKLEELASLVTRAAVWGGAVDPASIVDALQHAVLEVPAANPGPLVWAGDVMRFRGRSFAHLFAVRMQDEVFPQRRVEDPLLPDSDRRLLGLREIGDGVAEEDLLNQLLIDGTSSTLHFTWASTDGFGKPLRPSRYVRRLAESGAVEPLPKPVRETAGLDRLRRSLQLLTMAGSGGVFDGRITTIREQIAARLESVSPTQLEDFGECPQKFLLKHILAVEDLDAPDRELQINPREKGTLDHGILERFYRELSKEDVATAAALLPRLPDSLVQRLEAVIDEAFDEHEAESPAFNSTVRGIERRATRRLLRDFVAHDLADLVAQGLMPRHFEYRFGRKHRVPADHEEPYVVNAGDVTLRVEGTVDRIDTDHDRFRIVDYKSGKALQHVNLAAKIDRGVRLQLALYAMAVAEFFSVDPSKVSAAIKPLVVEGSNDAKFAFELAEKRDLVLRTLETFARAILAGNFPAFPQEKDFNSCKYCAVRHSCRTRHDSDERYAVLRHGDPLTLLGGGDAR